MNLLAYVAITQFAFVDIPSAIYASLVVPLLFDPPSHLFWPLWLAKYHGFAINLAVTYVLVAVAKNVKKFVYSCAPCLRYFNRLCYQWNLPQLGLHKSHEYFAYRVLISGLVHTLAHTLATHKFVLKFDSKYEGPISVEKMLLNERPEFEDLPMSAKINIFFYSLYVDSHTWTGYALLILLAVPVVATGLRLARYLRAHFWFLISHRIFAYITVPLFAFHHPIYFWPVFWTAHTVFDFALGLYYTERCVLSNVFRFPNEQLEDDDQRNDVIDVTFCYPFHKIQQIQPGDYVRIKVPEISHVEWHEFTLMKVNMTNVKLFDATVHLTIRSVGKWTKKFYRHAETEITVIYVKGPYSLKTCDPFIERLMRTKLARFERGNVERFSATLNPYTNSHCFQCLTFHCLRIRELTIPKTLFLICTGTAITHFLGVLDTLIPLYYDGYKTTELPQKIVLCWTVRTVFNLNFALLPLSKYQRILSDSKISDVLFYEFFVTRTPNTSDALSAQTFRRLLITAEAETYQPHFGTSRGECATMKIGLYSQSQLMRNSRMSTVDLVNNVSTSLGERMNFDQFSQRHLRDTDPTDTLIMLNTSVKEIEKRFREIAEKNKCKIIIDNLL